MRGLVEEALVVAPSAGRWASPCLHDVGAAFGQRDEQRKRAGAQQQPVRRFASSSAQPSAPAARTSRTTGNTSSSVTCLAPGCRRGHHHVQGVDHQHRLAARREREPGACRDQPGRPDVRNAFADASGGDRTGLLLLVHPVALGVLRVVERVDRRGGQAKRQHAEEKARQVELRAAGDGERHGQEREHVLDPMLRARQAN